MRKKKPELTLDSPVEVKLDAVKGAAKKFTCDFTYVISRDAEQNLISITVYAAGRYAAPMVRFVEGLGDDEDAPAKRRKPRKKRVQ